MNTILPCVFNTPLLQGAPDKVKATLVASVPFPKRLGEPDEYVHPAETMVTNGYFNGDGQYGWRRGKVTANSFRPKAHLRPLARHTAMWRCGSISESRR